MKKIAIVYRNVAGFSGTPNTIFDHAKYLAELGYSVGLIAEKLDLNRTRAAAAQAVRISRLPLLKHKRSRWFAWRADRLASGYDFVAGHGHNLSQDVLSLHNCIRLTHQKIHGRPLPVPAAAAEWQDLLFLRQDFKFCIANSKLMRSDLIQRYAVPPEKILVVYPGYQPERFNSADRQQYRDSLRREVGVAEEDILLGIITSGAFKKRGVDIAIDAFLALPRSVRDRASMVVIGKQSGLDMYRKMVADKGLASKVHILSARSDIQACYHGLDVYLHPARFEEFGQSVQEAMACGVPVITNRQVGAAELLSVEAYNALPEISDVAGLQELLEEFIVDADSRQRWRDYGLQAVEQNSDHINFEKTLQIYREAGL